jgi:lysophospholipase L1-like esterase
MRIRTIVLGFIATGLVSIGSGEAQQTALTDRDGNGLVELLAFGDSLTYGVGDDTPPGDYVEEITESGYPRGYPVRVSAALGVPVLNSGVPGEILTSGGVARFPGLVGEGGFDTVLILEGANDANFRVDRGVYARSLQKMINVARAEGKGIVLLTIPSPTGSRSSLQPFTNAYSADMRELAYLNEIPLIDIESSFVAACPDYSTCSLFNLPEGLHPNVLGYDSMATAIASGLQR